MALIKCENCGGNVSDKAKVCPHCGRVLNQEVPVIEESHEVKASQEPHPLRKSDSWLSLRFAMTAMIAIIVLAFAGYYWYEHRSNTPKRSYDSIESLTEAAEKGDADAQFELGKCFYNGEKVTQDLLEAVKWYRKAAENNHDSAQYELGFCYLCGEGVAQDYSNAVKWIRKAAEKGHSQAQCELGYLYQNGEGVPQDYDEAVKWYRKAAEKGNMNALSNLAVCYLNGYGVPKDLSEAEKLWQTIEKQRQN